MDVNKHRSWTPGLREANLLIYFVNLADNRGSRSAPTPPRTGKTGGFIIPNLILSELHAWAGPAVVIDPKGDAYKAVKRHRETTMGRKYYVSIH